MRATPDENGLQPLMKNGDKGRTGAIQKMDTFLSSSISSDFLSRGELEGFSCWYTATEKQLLGSHFQRIIMATVNWVPVGYLSHRCFGLVYNLLNW